MGCVYFLKHKGINGVKIGMSSKDYPTSRVDSAKTYSPNGIELIGFIKTKKAKSLEFKYHSKLVDLNINGEWFNVSEKYVLSQCFNCDIEINDKYLVVLLGDVLFKSNDINDCYLYIQKKVHNIDKSYDTKYYINVECRDRIHFREDFHEVNYKIIKPI